MIFQISMSVNSPTNTSAMGFVITRWAVIAAHVHEGQLVILNEHASPTKNRLFYWVSPPNLLVYKDAIGILVRLI